MPPSAQADLEPGPHGQTRLSGWVSPGSAPSATELAEQIVAARPATGYRSLDELTRTITMTAAQAEALATSGALDPLTGSRSTAGTDRRSALWAAGAAAGPRAGTLDGTHRRPRSAGAARDERHRADGRRHLGHRYLAGELSHRVLPADACRTGGCDRERPARGRARHPGAGGRHGHPPAAPGDRVRRHLHQPRGRDRNDQRDLLDRAVGQVPQGRPGQSAVAAGPRGGGTGGRGDLDRGRPDRPRWSQSPSRIADERPRGRLAE